MNLMQFNKVKCQALHPRRNNPRDQLGATQLEGSFAEKDLGALADTMLNINQHRAIATKEANGVLGCINASTAVMPAG